MLIRIVFEELIDKNIEVAEKSRRTRLDGPHNLQ